MAAALELDKLAEAGAIEHPHRTAVQIGDRKISYMAFAADVARMTAVLAAGGIGPGARFGISSDDPYLAWLATLAGLRIGGISVAVAELTPAEMADRLNLAAIATSHPGLAARIGASCRKVMIDPSALSAARETDITHRDSSSAARGGRILLSSGTTGRPKAVMLDVARLALTLTVNQVRYRIEEQTRLFSALGPNTSAGFRAVLITWWQGGTVILRRGRSVRSAAAAARAANRVLITPAGLRSLLSGLEPNARPIPGLAVFVGGGRLPLALRDAARARLSPDISIIYGASEIGGMCQCAASDLDVHPGMVGKPRPGATIEIVDSQGFPLPAGAFGHVRIRSDTMVEGYLDDPAATAAAFRNGWFYSGDLGALTPDGALIVSGRSTEVLNLGGVKLAPEDIEMQLAGIIGLSDVCVVTLPGGDGIEVLTVAAVPAPNASWPRMRENIAAALHRHHPVAVHRVDHIPRNAMGKVPREVFRQRLLDALAKAGRGPGPTSS